MISDCQDIFILSRQLKIGIQYCRSLQTCFVLSVQLDIDDPLKMVPWRWLTFQTKAMVKIPHTGDINLLTDADSSTNDTVGWTKNTRKPKKN